MSDTETSINNNITYETNNGKSILDYNTKKTVTTDTDFYFNMIANPNKTLMENHSATSESDHDKSPHDSVSESPISSAKHSPKHSPKPSPQKTKKTDTTSETNTHNYVPSRYTEDQPQMTPQEIRMKKIELLRRLSEIKTKGYNLSKEYDFNSSIDEMQYEYDLLKSFAEKRNGIKIYKNILLNVTSAIEFVNDKYDPFEFHLSGWSEHLAYDIESYDEVLEDLYEKYKGSGKKMAPEIKLLLLILASASAFHFTKSQTQSIKVPQQQTGSILNNMMGGKKESSQFMTEQEINIERLREELKAKEKKTQPQQPLKQMPQQIEPMASNTKPHLPQPQANTPLINTPQNVQEILSRIHNLQPAKGKINTNTDTQDDSANNDRLVSESTVTDSAKKNGRKKKSGISIM